jgi:hypothetical protein
MADKEDNYQAEIESLSAYMKQFEFNLDEAWTTEYNASSFVDSLDKTKLSDEDKDNLEALLQHYDNCVFFMRDRLLPNFLLQKKTIENLLGIRKGDDDEDVPETK